MKSPDSISKQRQALGIQELMWAEKLRTATTTEQRAFYKAEITKIRHSQNKLRNGTMAQRLAGFTN